MALSRKTSPLRCRATTVVMMKFTSRSLDFHFSARRDVSMPCSATMSFSCSRFSRASSVRRWFSPPVKSANGSTKPLARRLGRRDWDWFGAAVGSRSANLDLLGDSSPRASSNLSAKSRLCIASSRIVAKIAESRFLAEFIVRLRQDGGRDELGRQREISVVLTLVPVFLAQGRNLLEFCRSRNLVVFPNHRIENVRAGCCPEPCQSISVNGRLLAVFAYDNAKWRNGFGY